MMKPQDNTPCLTMVKAARQYWKTARFSYKNEARPDHGLLYLVKGQITYRTEEATVEMTPGEIIYLPKGSNYEVEFDITEGATEDILINFEAQGDAPSSVLPPTLLLKDCDGTLYPLFNEAAEAPPRPYLKQALLYRCIDGVKQALETPEENEEAALFRQTATQLIETDVATLCRRLHISRSVFQKKFRRYLGTSPREYRIRAKLMLAQRLLETTDLPIQEIASRTGCCDTAHFYKLFTQHNAITPKQYREQYTPK